MAAQPIPPEHPTVSPYLIIAGATKALDFYTRVLGAVETMRVGSPDGTIGHAEIRLGNSVIMLADEFPDMGWRSPKALGGTPVTLHVYVEDCDAVFQRAVDAGATITHPMEDKFYGDRSGTVTDPFGHVWHLSTHKEDLSAEEIERRAATLKHHS